MNNEIQAKHGIWQPMETAPRDGSTVLLRTRMGVTITGWFYEPTGNWVMHGVGRCDPVAWIPLPESEPPVHPFTRKVDFASVKHEGLPSMVLADDIGRTFEGIANHLQQMLARDIERVLKERITHLEGREPTIEEAAQRGRAIHYPDGKVEYQWDGMTILVVEPERYPKFGWVFHTFRTE